jgi:DNA-binding NtrC family response regulator
MYCEEGGVTAQGRLDGSQREFFHLVSRAAFANPFSDKRVELDEAIAPCPPGTPEEVHHQMVLARIRGEIGNLEQKGLADLRLYGSDDRLLLVSAFLFDIFHVFADEFDTLIAAQQRQGATPCEVPFAREMLARFSSRGFRDDEASRYTAMLYQLRRAYHFIDRGLIGKSPSMRALRLSLWNNVFTRDILVYENHLWDRMEDFSTILLGETGTGKGTAAAAIGRSGFIPFDTRRKRFTASFTEVFIPVNLALFPESLIESELFGHRKGAFTGAVDDHRGILSRCSPHGSVFLDEIGDTPPAVQVKLLQVLQERLFSPVGSHEKVRFEGRVIAATNRPLDELRGQGLFREDFYYRLCSDCIVVPPLRQRLAEEPGEMGQIVAAIVRRILGAAKGETVSGVAAAIEGCCGTAYTWPGNVRELEQAVRRILLTGSYRPAVREAGSDLGGRLAERLREGGLRADELLAAYCGLLYRQHGTYEEVARRTGLDRRTVKKHVVAFSDGRMLS